MAFLTTIQTLPAFASDAAGLEKTLRLFQALAQLMLAYSVAPSSLSTSPWAIARTQFALGKPTHISPQDALGLFPDRQRGSRRLT